MAEGYEPRSYSVFRRMDKYAIPGISGKTALYALAALAVGALIFLGLGCIGKNPENTQAFKDTAIELSELRAAAALRTEEEAAAAGDGEAAQRSTAIYNEHFAGWTAEEIYSLAGEADERGVLADTSDEDIYMAALGAACDAPERALSGIERFIIGIVPAVMCVCLRFERKGTSLAGELSQLASFRRSQKIFEHRNGKEA